MLDKLTPQQEAKIPEYFEKWLAIATAETPTEFYDAEALEAIKDAVVGAYDAAEKEITRDKIFIVDSPIMAMFVASAHVCGKPGKPEKPVKWKGDSKLTGMEAVENYLNGFENPTTVIKQSSKFTNIIYWGMPIAGYYGYLDFFKRETDIKVDFKNSEYGERLTILTHMLLISDGFCVVSKRPCVLRTNRGSAIADGSPYMAWGDGIGVIA